MKVKCLGNNVIYSICYYSWIYEVTVIIHGCSCENLPMHNAPPPGKCTTKLPVRLRTVTQGHTNDTKILSGATPPIILEECYSIVGRAWAALCYDTNPPYAGESSVKPQLKVTTILIKKIHLIQNSVMYLWHTMYHGPYEMIFQQSLCFQQLLYCWSFIRP